jgi:hypothetical protein
VTIHVNLKYSIVFLMINNNIYSLVLTYFFTQNKANIFVLPSYPIRFVFIFEFELKRGK